MFPGGHGKGAAFDSWSAGSLPIAASRVPSVTHALGSRLLVQPLLWVSFPNFLSLLLRNPEGRAAGKERLCSLSWGVTSPRFHSARWCLCCGQQPPLCPFSYPLTQGPGSQGHGHLAGQAPGLPPLARLSILVVNKVVSTHGHAHRRCFLLQRTSATRKRGGLALGPR